MTFLLAVSHAERCGMRSEFLQAYHWIKPWWAFWISEESAVEQALAEWDLLQE